MENQTRFDLNNAIASWKQELTAQPGISAEDARELETHLLDAIADLKDRGVGDREVFEKARRQIGAIDRIAEEYAKAHPMRTWRERVFWMAFACVAITVWNWVVTDLIVAFNSIVPASRAPSPLLLGIYVMVATVFPVMGVAFLACGRGGFLFRVLHWFCASRIRFVVTAITFLAALALGSLRIIRHYSIPGSGWEDVNSAQLLTSWLTNILLWPGPMIALMTWLLPRRRSTSEAANEGGASYGPAISRERVFWMAIGAIGIYCWNAAMVPAWKVPASLAVTFFPNSETPFLLLRWALQMAMNCAPLLIGILAAQGRLNRIAAHVAQRLRNRGRVALGIGAIIVAAQLIQVFSLDYHPSQRLLVLLQSFLWPAGLLACVVWLLPKRQEDHKAVV